MIIITPDETIRVFPQLVTSSTKSIFVAGGITGCPDWQSEFMSKFSPGLDIVFFNPRRTSFDIENKSETERQIAWEYKHLRLADLIVFWFPKETLCPIVLFELGCFSSSEKPIIVGCHPEYKRADDVIIQMRLARPKLSVVGNLPSLYIETMDWLGKNYVKMSEM